MACGPFLESGDESGDGRVELGIGSLGTLEGYCRETWLLVSLCSVLAAPGNHCFGMNSGPKRENRTLEVSLETREVGPSKKLRLGVRRDCEHGT